MPPEHLEVVNGRGFETIFYLMTQGTFETKVSPKPEFPNNDIF